MITGQQAAQMNPMQRNNVLHQVEAILKKERNNLDALLSGAALHHANKHTEKAIALLQRALKADKKNMNILRWLAIACAEIHEFKNAKMYSRKLVESESGNSENWQIRGRILDSSGDPSGALAAFERQLKLQGEYPELVFQIANCHSYLGDHDKAGEGYRRTIELEPTHALALYGLSTVHKFTEDEVSPYVEKVEAAVPANASMPAYNTSALYYGAAKSLDDTKAYDKAFTYYQKANDFRRPDNTINLSKQFDNNRAVFTQDYMSPRSQWGDASKSPIFALGLPRSGTTLIESYLAAHSKITAGGEMSFMDDIALKIGAMQLSQQEFSAVSQKLTKADVKDMARTYLEGAKAACGANNLFVDKMPHNFMNTGLILLLFPNAKIIHSRRHPMDVCVSIYTNGMTPAHNYYKSDLQTLGTYYNHYLDLMDHWHETFPDRILDVYYEDVVANGELNSRRMIDFCKLPWEEKVSTRENSQTAVKTLSAWQVRQPVYKTAQGKWKRFETHLSPLIDALGGAIGTYENQLEQLSSQQEV